MKKLQSITGRSGLIEEDLIRELDKTVSYTDEEMMLILAHLNIIKQYIDANGVTHDTGVVKSSRGSYLFIFFIFFIIMSFCMLWMWKWRVQ